VHAIRKDKENREIFNELFRFLVTINANKLSLSETVHTGCIIYPVFKTILVLEKYLKSL
jgi:hypothetical protein